MKHKVAILGLGMMGRTHLEIYLKRNDVEVIAVADINSNRLNGEEEALGNIKGQITNSCDLTKFTRYKDAFQLIENEKVDIIDICLPTPLHLDAALAAIGKGRHVLVEKPVCRTAEGATQLCEAVDKSRSIVMPAMCMRFWPGWDTLRAAISNQSYGRLLTLSIQRLAAHPGGPFYSNHNLCGGAILDLHIHDTDFIFSCLGNPEAVRSTGSRGPSGGWDYISTQYVYDRPVTVTAEGGWTMKPGFPFTMRYIANFVEATLVFDLSAGNQLLFYKTDGTIQSVELEHEQGYSREINYFLDCVATGRSPNIVSLKDAVSSLRIVETEQRSLTYSLDQNYPKSPPHSTDLTSQKFNI